MVISGFRRISIRMGVTAAAALTAGSAAHAAFPTAINSQITDSVTQVNVKVLGEAPAMAMGNLFQATSQALSNAALNATMQQSYITAQAATTMGVTALYSIDQASVGTSIQAILGGSTAAPSPTPSQKGSTGLIPAEGFLAGAALWAFDNDGVPGAVPDFWVVTDEGYDFFRDTDGNLVLIPVNVRTFGEAESAINNAVIWIPPTAVDQYFPGIFDDPTASGPQGQQKDLDPFTYNFGVRDANGQIAYFGAYLTAVPEPSSLLFAGAAFAGLLLRKRRTPAT